MVFCNLKIVSVTLLTKSVTILILVDGFLQSKLHLEPMNKEEGHNPYFSRWFSAIKVKLQTKVIKGFVTILILVDGFLQ